MSKQSNLWKLRWGEYPLKTYPDGPPKQAHSPTSTEAAESIKPVLGKLQEIVYAYLQSSESIGATDEEMQAHLDMPANTQRPRRCELLLKGLIKDSGERRPTKSGRKAVVWCVSHE